MLVLRYGEGNGIVEGAEKSLNSLLKDQNNVLYVENPDGTKVTLQPGFKIGRTTKLKECRRRALIDYMDLLMEQQEQM